MAPKKLKNKPQVKKAKVQPRRYPPRSRTGATLYQAPLDKPRPKRLGRPDGIKKPVGAKTAGIKKAVGAKKTPTRQATKKDKTTTGKKKGNERLVPRPEIKVLTKDPFFDGPVPTFVSVRSYHRWLLRALRRKDSKELKAFFASKKYHQHLQNSGYSYANKWAAELEVARSGDVKLIDEYYKKVAEVFTPNKAFPTMEPNLLQLKQTGCSNYYMVGARTRAIEMTRGGREGNNAFLKYEAEEDRHEYLDLLIQEDIPYNILLAISKKANASFNEEAFQSCVVTAARMGHRRLAAAFAQGRAKVHMNELHIRTLKDEKLPDRILTVSVLKKGFENRNITPLHTAAINPNVKYLETLRTVCPNINIPDQNNWYTVHYAAACEGPEPLKYLIKNGATVAATNKQMETCLHVAARAGRSENLKIIIDELIKLETPDAGSPIKPEKSMLNARNRNGLTALHLAVAFDRPDVIRELLSHETVIVDMPSSTTKDNFSPFMMACAKGNLEIAQLLFKNGALVEKRDKKKKTALIYAVTNGQLHIVTFLLSLGADLHVKDSSGNSASHYAAAYGWLHVLEYLAKVDDACLSVENDWKLTPLHVAYLKGHYGIVNWLLDGDFKDKVNINGKDNNGTTLLASLLTYSAGKHQATLEAQIQYLVDRGADASLEDGLGLTPLHIFASSKLNMNEKAGEGITVKQVNNIIDLLLKANGDILKKNLEGKTPLHSALRTNLFLFELLLKKAGPQREFFSNWDEHQNFLHALVTVPFHVFETRELWQGDKLQVEAYDVVKILKNLDDSDVLVWLQETNAKGQTPLALAVQRYTELNLDRYTVATAEANTFIYIINTIIEHLVKIDHTALTNPVSAGDEKKWLWADTVEIPVERKNGKPMALFVRMLLLAEDVGVLKEFLSYENELGDNLILQVALRHNFEATKKLLEISKANNITKGVHDSIQKKEKRGEQVVEVNRTLLMLLANTDMFYLLSNLVLPKDHWALRDSEGNTVWHYAARINHYRTVQVFKIIEKRLDVKEALTNNKGRTPLHEASLACDGSANSVLEPITWLSTRVDAGIKDNDGRMAIHYAFGNEDNFKKHTLHSANTDPIALVSILAHAVDPAKLNDSDNDGNTILHLAALRDSTVCAVTFLRKGLDVNAKNNAGNTPLGLAALHGKRSIALTLIQADSNVTCDVFSEERKKEEKDKNLKWIWEFAAILEKEEAARPSSIPAQIVSKGFGWESMVYIILDVLGQNVDSIIHLVDCAVEKCQFNLATQLLKTVESMQEGRPLVLKHDILTTFAKNFKGILQPESAESVVLEKVLEFGARIIDTDGHSDCIEAALEMGNWSLLTFFKKQLGDAWKSLSGRPIDKVFSYLLRQPKSAEAFDWLNKLTKLPNLSLDEQIQADNSDVAHFTISGEMCPLSWAVVKGKYELVEDLIGLGANKRTKDVLGRTPLMLAMLTNKEDCVKVLFGNKISKVENLSVVVAAKATPATFGIFGAQVNNGYDFGFAGRKVAATFGFSARSNQARREDSESDESSRDDEEMFEHEVEEEVGEEERYEDEQPVAKKAKLSKEKMKIDSSIVEDVDKSGKNVVHYMLEPFGWENTQLLQQMADSNQNLMKKLIQQKDSKGESPLSLSSKLLQRRIRSTMLTILGKGAAQADKKSECQLELRNVSHLDCPHHVEADSKAFIDKWTAQNVEKKKAIIPKPHKLTDYSATGELVFDDATQQYYNILVTKTDVHIGSYGFHNFYRMQLIKRRDADLWILFTNWGRIGEGQGTGEYQKTPFSSEELGVKEFKSVWKSKTGNEWASMDKFKVIPKKYRLIDVDDTPSSLADLEIPDVEDKKVDDPVLEIIRDISRPNVLKAYAKGNSHAGSSVPFGRITKEQIEKARKILKKCEETRLKIEKMLQESVNDETVLLSIYNQVADYTNDFYSIIPLGDFEFSRLTRFDDKRAIHQALNILNRMEEVEVATTILTAAAEKNGLNRLQYIKSAIECDFEMLSPSDFVSQRILQAIHNGGGRNSVVKGILAIYPKGAVEGFEPWKDDVNQKWLWHGTKPTNIMSIIKRGFLVDPPIVARNGDLFGPGIYLSDSFEKSSHYCQMSKNEVNYMFLCRTALGKVREIRDLCHSTENIAAAVKGEDTLQYIGENFCGGFLNMNGASLPILPYKRRGRYEGTWGPSLEFTEYIVRNPQRILPSYIVMYK